MFFTNLGNAFKMIAGDIPDCKWKDKGTPFKTIFSEALSDEYPVAVFEVPENMESNLIFFSRAGMIKKTAWKEYGLLKNYFQAAKFKDDDRLVDVQPENTDPKCTLLFVTKAGMTLNAFNNDVPLQGRISGGVKGIQLADKDEVVFITQAMPKTEIVLVTNKGFAKKVKINEIEPMARYRKGVKIIDFGKENGNEIVFASLVSDKKDIVLKNSENEPISISTANLEIQPRVSKGKSIFKAKNNMDINFGYTFEIKV